LKRQRVFDFKNAFNPFSSHIQKKKDWNTQAPGLTTLQPLVFQPHPEEEGLKRSKRGNWNCGSSSFPATSRRRRIETRRRDSGRLFKRTFSSHIQKKKDWNFAKEFFGVDIPPRFPATSRRRRIETAGLPAEKVQKRTFSSVFQPHPEEEGLKHGRHSVRVDHPHIVFQPHPEEEGLKQTSPGWSSHFRRCFPATSRRRRIETPVNYLSGWKAANVFQPHPEEEGLKQVSPIRDGSQNTRFPATSRRRRIETFGLKNSCETNKWFSSHIQKKKDWNFLHEWCREWIFNTRFPATSRRRRIETPSPLGRVLCGWAFSSHIQKKKDWNIRYAPSAALP